MEGYPKQGVPGGFWDSPTPPKIMHLNCCDEKPQKVAGVLRLVACETYAGKFKN